MGRFQWCGQDFTSALPACIGKGAGNVEDTADQLVHYVWAYFALYCVLRRPSPYP